MKPLLCIQPHPCGEDDDALARLNLPVDQIKQHLVLGLQICRAADVLGGGEYVLVFLRYKRVADWLMAVGLVGISGQQVQIRGHHPLADPGFLAHQMPEAVLQGVVFLFDFRQHGTRKGDFLVVGQFLSHVVQRQEHRVFQQKPRIHDGRDTRQEPFPYFALSGFGCAVVFGGILFVHFFQHPILQTEIPRPFVHLVIQQHQAGL